MKRDWDLIRCILLDVRDNADASGAYLDPLRRRDGARKRCSRT